MNVVWGALVTLAVSAAAIGAMLLVRRRAPEGGYFADGDRAAGVFGVLASGFGILLGLIVFLAFTSYDESRTGAETEALLVAQQFKTAQFMPAAVRAPLGNEMICYARSIVHDEWPDMAAGRAVPPINPWAVELYRTLREARPTSATEQSAYDKWLDQTADREQARNDRLHAADGIIPGTLWAVLFFIAAVILVFMFFLADSGERAVVQALLIGSVIGVIVATLLLIRSLDDPYASGYGALRPVAMERTLDVLGREQAIFGDAAALPCDAGGAPVGA